MPQPIEIPESVLDGLEEVRASARTNMGDRQTVIHLLICFFWNDAAEWLNDNPGLYMEALHQMGQRVK